MKKSTVLCVFLAALALVAGGCGKPAGPAGDQAVTTNTAPGGQAGAATGESEGVLLAKEILALFDEAVAETAGLGKGKPEPAALKPQLDSLYAKYEQKMTELNGKYLALKAKDVKLFGECNSYMGENRGKHVFQKDNTLGPMISYYNLEKGDKETVAFLSNKLPTLIDVATKM